MTGGGQATPPAWKLPPAVSQEILRRYADVCRVGRITLNGAEVCWNTACSTESQLGNFCQSFHGHLVKACPELAASEPAALRFAPYWFCKAVSINYALIEVVLMVKRRVGVLCTIETREDRGSGLVEYHVEIRAGNVMCISLVWKKADNIVHCDPHTAKRQVKGTLPYLETWFRLPPVEDFTPAYSFQLRLKRTIAQKASSSLTSTLACGADKRKVTPMETISIDEPLRSNHPLETFAELAALPSEGPAALADQAAHGPTAPSSTAVSRPQPLDSTGSADSLEDFEAPEGYLRFRVVRANDLVNWETQTWPDGRPMAGDQDDTEIYATCCLAGRTQQTRQVPIGPAPEWRESLHFPLRQQDLRDEVAVRLFLYNQRRGLRFWGRAAVPVSSALGVGSPSGEMPCINEEDSVCKPSSSGRLAVRLDGNGGTISVELELVPEDVAKGGPEAEIRNPIAESSKAKHARGVAGSSQKIGCVPRRDNRSGGREEEECIVEVGTPLGVGGLFPAELPPPPIPGSALDGIRGLDLIRVRGGEKPEAKSQSFWCVRPCT